MKLSLPLILIGALLAPVSGSSDDSIGLGRISGDQVRLRKNPKGDIIAELKKGTWVSVTSRTEAPDTINGVTAPWYEVDILADVGKIRRGWVFGRFVLKVEGETGASELRFACEAAAAPVRYDRFRSTIPPNLQDVIADYKSKWRDFCREKGRGAVTFSHIVVAFEDLLKQYENAYEDAMTTGGMQFARLDQLTAEDFFDFVPVFKYYEIGDTESPYQEGGPYDGPSRRAMALVAREAGDEEDALFLSDYHLLLNRPNQKIHRVPEWCMNYKFDWTGSFERAAHLRKSLTKEIYKKRLADLKIEKRLLDSLEVMPRRGPICSCGPREDVLPTYEKLVDYFSGVKGYGEDAVWIAAVAEDIKDGRIPILLYGEGQCKGRADD